MKAAEPIHSFSLLAEAMALRDGAVEALVFTDASFSLQSGRGGWGAWIGPAGSVRGYMVGGPLGGHIVSSTEAEIRAIANAVAIARKHLEPKAAVLIQSDSMNALGWILATYGRAKDWAAPDGQGVNTPDKVSEAAGASRGLAVFCEIVAALELVVFTRHVEAHCGAPTLRHVINERCDALAGRHRRDLERKKGQR